MAQEQTGITHHDIVIGMDTFVIETYLPTGLGEPARVNTMGNEHLADFLADILVNVHSLNVSLSPERTHYEVHGKWDDNYDSIHEY